MTTLASLEAACQALIGDTGTTYFTADQIDYWINAAVADLNNYFPRRLVYDVTTAAADHDYDLPANTIAVLSVEYPISQTPREYLQRLAYTADGFWLSEDYYDFLPSNAVVSPYLPRLIVSATTPASSTIRCELHAEHNTLSGPTDVTTVLARHEHLIALFVRWKALQELAATEGYNPDPIKKLAGELELAASRAGDSYREALDLARKAESVSASAAWQMDNKDRIY